jgi:Bacterial toxin 50
MWRRWFLGLLTVIALALVGLGAGVPLGHAGTTTAVAGNCDYDHLSAFAQGADTSTLRVEAPHEGFAPLRAVARVGVAAKARPEVNWGRQEKHFVGHNSYSPGRSELTADPRKLLDRAGTGEPVGSVARGNPGFKERVDFGEEIGVWVDPHTGKAFTTTRGILHYSKKGVYIVPSRPGS